MTKKLIFTILVAISAMFLVSCGGTGTTTLTQGIALPDLQDQNITDIETTLNDLGIDYTIQYETNPDLTEGLFISYGNDYQAGDLFLENESVIVIIATHDLYLPDLSGMDQLEIFTYLTSLGFNIANYSFEMVIDNSVEEDQTFVGYKNDNIGDELSESDQFIILIGYKTTTLPDLEGKIERQIKNILEEDQIQYEFSTIVDDDYPAGTFAYYNNGDIGDEYSDGTIIEVVLYDNTFTDDEENIFISKYIDSETDSAIEIFNPLEESVDLNDYHIAIFLNGSYDVTHRIDFEDDTVLEPGDTFLIVSKTSDANLQRLADLRADDFTFDGNDTIQLRYKNDTYIDTIYQIGDRTFVFDNEIFVRREGINVGNRTFTFNEWTAFVPGYYEIIGTHPLNIEDKLSYDQFQISDFINRTFDSPIGGMDEVILVHVSDGDTAGFYPGYSNEERVRFIGTDTPETAPTVPVSEPWAEEASKYTKAILNYADDNDLPIYIQSDPDVGYTENYGRHLGLVWVDFGEDVFSIEIKDSDGVVNYTEELTGMILVNYHIVKNGYSNNFYDNTSKLIINNRYMVRWFQEAEKFARDNNLGIHE